MTDAGITWQCSRCDNENPLDAQICAVCGTTFADSLRPPAERPNVDPNSIAMYSLFFPGAGHWKLGQKGAAVARAILSTWVAGVALVAAIAGSTLMAAAFGLATFALWTLAAHDAYREASGDASRVILKNRVFVYVVLGLLMLMMVMLVTAGMRVNG